jgi:transposase
MTSPPDLRSLDPSDKDALIVALLARVEELCVRVAALEAKQGLPPKTPDNSSTPPSQGRKASRETTNKPKGKPHADAHRPLHPNPTSKRDVFAASRQHCGTEVSDRPQIACHACDRIEIPDIRWGSRKRPIKPASPTSFATSNTSLTPATTCSRPNCDTCSGAPAASVDEGQSSPTRH